MAQALHILVDGGILFNIGIGLRDVGLGLVVVVVGNEVLDRVVWQQAAELIGQLCRQRLVRCHDQGWPLHLFNQPRCGG